MDHTVDTQIIFLNFCGLMFFYFSVRVFLGKYRVELLSHPLIIIFLLAVSQYQVFMKFK